MAMTGPTATAGSVEAAESVEAAGSVVAVAATAGSVEAAGSAPVTAESVEAAGPRWLDVEQQQAWRSYLAATQLLGDHIDRQLQRDTGIPHTYYLLLAWLSEAPQRTMRMTELAERSKITRSRLSHAINRLEKSGWLRREHCPTDRRGQFAVLTEEGRKVLEKAAPGHVRAVREAVFDRLDPEQVRQLDEIMRIVAEGLAPRDRTDVPWLR